MKSRKLRKLVAGVTMLAMSLMVTPVSAITLDNISNNSVFENNWSLNAGNNSIATVSSTSTTLASDAAKTDETSITVDKIETKALNRDVTVDGVKYLANDSEGGVVRIGLRLSGRLESALRGDIDRAVNEHRDNVNAVNSNRHNGGSALKVDNQKVLASKFLNAINVKDANGNNLNRDVKLIVTYELGDGRIRTTSVSLSDLKFDIPNTSNVSSADDLNSIVDENGLVYMTLRGLPTDATITNVELDSRKDLTVATDNLGGTARNYSVQSSLSYNAGSVKIPTSTWVLTDSLYKTLGNGIVQAEPGSDNVINNGDHVFVKATGTTITLIDLFRDINKTITSIVFTDRRGDTYNAEVGEFESGSYQNKQGNTVTVDYGNRYRDVRITGLNNRTTYDFEYMDVNYTVNGEGRTQRIRFDNKVATGGVTGDKYLSLATTDNSASQIYGYDKLGSTLYQVNVGLDRLVYLVRVDDTTNLDRIEVRGLRGNEEYTVKNVKSKDGKNSSSNWFAVEITNLDSNRNYDFLSLETVYNDNGRERYGTPISLGRNSTADALFPNSTSSVNMFTTTNKDYQSEVWIDSDLKYEQVPGGVRFVGRVKDADNLLDGVTVYVNNGGSYERVDDARVTFTKSYRVVEGLDVNGTGGINGDYTIDYPLLTSSQIKGNERTVESASEMVEITITGIDSDKTKDFRFDFTTKQDGNRVSAINSTNVGAFGSIPTSSTKTQQAITRYASGRAGATKVDVTTTDVKVSGVTTNSATVTATIKNPDKESINVEVTGSNVAGVTAKYNVEKNIIELTGLKPGTDYKDLKLTLRYGTKTTTLTVPEFKTTTTTQTETGLVGYVTRVYRAFFNREPDKDGLLYWTSKLSSGEETLKGFLTQIAFTPELLEKNLTNTQFVEAMYAIVDRAGETEGVTFWVGEIEKGIKEGATQSQARAAAVERMINTDEVKSMATKLGIKFE